MNTVVKYVLAVSLSLCAGAAFADTATSTSAAGVSGVTSSAAQEQGNSQALIINNPAFPSKTEVKTAPTLYTPGLTTTLSETCMGSVSLGVSVMGGGVAGGTTTKDDRCGNRLDSRELYNRGEVDVAKEVMCGTPEVRKAYKRVNRPCIEDVAAANEVSAPKQVKTGVEGKFVTTK